MRIDECFFKSCFDEEEKSSISRNDHGTTATTIAAARKATSRR